MLQIKAMSLILPMFQTSATLGRDKVRTFTCTPPQRKISDTICNHQTAFKLYMWSDMMIYKPGKEYVIQDAECPSRDQASLNGIT